MNAKAKLHKSKLSLWTTRFEEQAASGLTVKEWCKQNDISIYAYQYWKRIAKESYLDSILPDIVPLATTQTALPVESNPTQFSNLYDSRNSLNTPSNIVTISLGDIHIEIGSNASDEIRLI